MHAIPFQIDYNVRLKNSVIGSFYPDDDSDCTSLTISIF